ncbi:ribonucleoprotein PTB-binding 2 isoform X4 [Anas platyrhynchos]|uniref:ribonucleoprotein PTB-binding 2 isoform X4 n=1 Tax=Anas platyrhynchos TaxID=8839 RepID=UPI000F7CBB71|nr:ribonucleoprotein PTB-binding 2 isoform X5 [Anas platyrhynchos]|eukprot:XP_027319595.1 ribonucleoprotein PTB-binding 2 isoform X5 [Anas platyrhynchos]
MAAAAERGAELPAEEPPPPLPPLPRGARPPPPSPEEVARRLASTRRELSNRRKILLRNLPAESSSQEIHDLFKDYEIKYCYVDRNKRTAFVTLLNGEQAQNAIRKFHQYSLRGKEISVQLQPTDALLCITNLPISFTLEEFEELVRAYGNVERCFLVYNEVTGHSKGYGFVEYMKKDSAAKARLELLGKQLDESTLFAQWMDVNQLTTSLIHSKCLCVDKLQKDYTDSKELMQAFSLKYKPVFCQFAQDEDSCIGDFAVVEYETAEQAEKVQEVTDGMIIKGKRIQVSYCAPGAPGRSTLAALIAAQRMMRNNRKGLLPEPNAVQIMKSFNNPAMLQILLQPQLRGHAVKPVLGTGFPHLINTAVGPPFLQLNKVHQSSVLGSASNLLLQSPAHLPLPQQQLMKIENVQANSKPGLLGEPPTMLLQTVLGIGVMPSVTSGMGTRGEALKSSNLPTIQTAAAAAGMGMLPFFPNQHIVGQALPGQNNAPEKQSTTEAVVSGSQPYHQTLTNLPAGALRAGHAKQQNQLKSTDTSLGTPLKKQTSLLGEPPKEIRLSTNPYLNLASVLPGICLPAIASKASSPPQQTGLPNNIVDAAVSQGATSQHGMEGYFNYSQQHGEYTQEAAQQWYQHYAQAYNSTQARVDEFENEASEVAPSRSEKRGSSYLISSPEPGPVEYIGQQAQGSAMRYTESSLKKKRVY